MPGKKCPHCNVDIVLYMGITRLSNKLFNQGLERLKVADFYHGIEFLSKSVAINKNNVPARNLLGLALFETGHVGDALKHWVISTSLLKTDNPASRYIDKAHKNPRSLEKMNDAVGMFNQALGHIKQKSDDLAIIQLKKAVDTNPRFIDAFNLLTLCFLIQNDKERASAASERVLALDSLNPIALNYYNILHPNKARPLKPHSRPGQGRSLSESGPYKTINLEEKKPKNFHIAEILFFIIGAACAAALLYFLFIPAVQREHDSQMQVVRNQLEHAINRNQADIETFTEQAEELREQIALYESEIQSMNNTIDLQDREIRVHHAFRFYLDDQLRRAVDTIDGLDTTGFAGNLIERIDEIRAGAYPRLGAEYYTEGRAAFNADDHALALIYLQDAHYFLDDEATQWNEILFMLASIFYSMGGDRLAEAEEFLLDLQYRVPNFRATAIRNMLESIEAQS